MLIKADYSIPSWIKDYTDNELRETRNNLYYALTNIKLVDKLPKPLKTYINTENPHGGNESTMIVRCISILDREIVNRFVNQTK
jgi:hypothetical protein